MLFQLSIKNFTIIEYIELDFNSGMTVITGETGAGKSIILEALSLTLGDRANLSTIPPEKKQTEVSASFDITHIDEAKKWLNKRSIEHQNICILRRVISKDGRSKAFINNTPCLLTDLKKIGNLLIDIHNQHQHHHLLHNGRQQQLLTNFTGCFNLLSKINDYYINIKKHESTLKHLLNKQQSLTHNQELINYQIEELETLNIQEKEIINLENIFNQLTNFNQISDSCHKVIASCSENERFNLISILEKNIQELEKISNNKNHQLNEAHKLLLSSKIQINEANNEIKNFINNIEEDPKKLSEIELQLDKIYSLARKHQVQPHQLEQTYQQLINQKEENYNSTKQTEEITKKINTLTIEYTKLALELDTIYKKNAPILSKLIETEIQRLGMPNGHFSIETKTKKSLSPNPTGLSSIEFLVNTNPGQQLSPLKTVSSGGELSRISLAIQVITAKTSQTPSLIFDEVDVGIGGEIASIVGELLYKTAKNGQIITITHLPQVACFADQHIHISKKQSNSKTKTILKTLSPQERIEEIARMFDGNNLSKESIAYAKQMIKKAHASS